MGHDRTQPREAKKCREDVVYSVKICNYFEEFVWGTPRNLPKHGLQSTFQENRKEKKVSIWKNDILIKGIAVGLDGNVQETISKIYD